MDRYKAPDNYNDTLAWWKSNTRTLVSGSNRAARRLVSRGHKTRPDYLLHTRGGQRTRELDYLAKMMVKSDDN